MRFFIAVSLPSEVKNELYRIQKSINPEFAKIKWISKKNLHLTLKFIGEYKNEEDIKKQLSTIKFEKFEIILNKLEVFPDYFNIRIMWVDLEPKEKILNLQKQVDENLIEIIQRDQKFSSHLTLGRVKSIKHKKEFLESLKLVKVNPIKFEMNEFRLMSSRLTKEGPIYRIIETFKA
ncbi:RNA 2',3'-cyclic phosphodiesterase [Candidatus Woesearchaeota archaeon]|nr:RNA 2',3'-cyclic phosphodiesterase [Candidatus Woesearchaeota archaeon]